VDEGVGRSRGHAWYFLCIFTHVKRQPHAAVTRVVQGKRIARKGKIVSNEFCPQVASFIQAILDASFLSLLQHPPAYPILRSISDQIAPELELINEAEQLRIPFDGLLREHKRVVAEKKEREQASQSGSGGKGDKSDWRRKRKEAFQQASLAVGLYQIEEILL